MGNTRSGDSEFAKRVFYQMRIHASSKNLVFTPSEFVIGSFAYHPSNELRNQIRLMWEYRKPRTIGIVSELVTKEIIAHGQIEINDNCLPLICQSLKSFAESHEMSLTPRFGIRSD